MQRPGEGLLFSDERQDFANGHWPRVKVIEKRISDTKIKKEILLGPSGQPRSC